MAQTVLYIIAYASLNVTGAAMIKWHLKGKTLSTLNEWLSFLYDVSFLFAFILIMLSALALFKALSINNFSITIPVATGINFLLTIGVGHYIFRDKLSVLSLLGIFLIISGIVIISIYNRK